MFLRGHGKGHIELCDILIGQGRCVYLTKTTWGGAYALSPASASGFEDFVAGFVYKKVIIRPIFNKL